MDDGDGDSDDGAGPMLVEEDDVWIVGLASASGAGTSGAASGSRGAGTDNAVCTICLDPFSGATDTAAIRLGCGHVYHWVCATNLVEATSGDASAGLLCPDLGCRAPLLPSEIEMLGGAEAARRAEKHSMGRAVAGAPSLHGCPTPDCDYVVAWAGEPGDGEPKCYCFRCKATTCLACGQPWHAGVGCAAAAAQAADDDAKTRAYLASSKVRICPRCRTGLVKASGCDTMMCRCGHRFCYACGVDLGGQKQCDYTPRAHGFVNPESNRAVFPWPAPCALGPWGRRLGGGAS